MKMQFDYSKLRGKVVEKFGSLNGFSQAIEISNSTLSLLFNNRSKWNQETIMKAIKVLEISVEDIPVYFFAPKVQNT